MTSAISNPVELRSRGFQALVKELGWVNAVRFLRDYETGGGTTCANAAPSSRTGTPRRWSRRPCGRSRVSRRVERGHNALHVVDGTGPDAAARLLQGGPEPGVGGQVRPRREAGVGRA